MNTTSLSARDCWDVLEQARVGRLLYTVGALPVALPVRFAIQYRHIVLSVNASVALHIERIVAGGFAAFQADDLTSTDEKGRSVTVYGRAAILGTDELRFISALGLPAYDGQAVYASILPLRLWGEHVNFVSG